MAKPVDASGSASIFKWETLKEIGPYDIKLQDRTIPGKILEVELTSGEKIRSWRGEDGQEYFCHGLTFGGKQAPGGVISPMGNDVPTILRGHYESIVEVEAGDGDIVVWRGDGTDDVVHSAILTDPIVTPTKKVLDYAARLQTKNGFMLETIMTLEDLCEKFYGESYNTFRKKS